MYIYIDTYSFFKLIIGIEFGTEKKFKGIQITLII